MPSIEYDCQCQREDCHNWTGFRVGDVYWGEGDNKTTGLWINICDSKGTDLEVLLDPYSADDLGRRLYVMTRPKKLKISYARDRVADIAVVVVMIWIAIFVSIGTIFLWSACIEEWFSLGTFLLSVAILPFWALSLHTTFAVTKELFVDE
jgi:hypothetical protein